MRVSRHEMGSREVIFITFAHFLLAEIVQNPLANIALAEVSFSYTPREPVERLEMQLLWLMREPNDLFYLFSSIFISF